MTNSPRVFYAEYTDYLGKKPDGTQYIRNFERELKEKLNKNNIEFAFLGKNKEEKDNIMNKFRDTKSILGSYDIFIAHMGTQFHDQIGDILRNYPKLTLIVVTDYPENYPEKEGKNSKYLICGYDSDRLIPYIKKVLEKE
jgi:hypothetical protein